MKKIFVIASAIAAALFMTSCGSAEKMAKQAENVIVKCNPNPLTVKGGQIDADVTVTYPEKYFDKKAVLEVTPVIVYEGGEEKLTPKMYQGEKVENNYKVVPAAGGTVTEHFTFPYKEGMAKCTFELRGRASTNEGKKWIDLPTKKVADGCNITELLLCTKGAFETKADNYQEKITLNPEGQVMYQINSAYVNNRELKSESVKEFKAALADAVANERMEVKGVDVVAYASPDGPEDKNNTLSDNRSNTADKAFKKIVKKDKDLKGIVTEVKSVGEDWEGFQELVSNSNVEDKDLILRVLSMYTDANVREKEIRNMASVYQDLAKDILPQLRRARFIANVEYTNYTAEELDQLIKSNIDVLDEEALLRAAANCKKNADKVALYKKAIEKFNSARAKYNLACVALDEKEVGHAQDVLKTCDATDADVKNVQGVCAMREGNWNAAKQAFAAAGNEAAAKNLGACAIKEGDYATAVAKCGDKGFNAALANVLSGNPAKALQCLGDCQCPRSNYLRAICLNRQGKTTEAKAALDKATAANAELAKRAATDIEFANLK